MPLTVVATKWGAAYHFDPSCRALDTAQDLHDWDCDEYCRHQHSNPNPKKRMSSTTAAMLGKWPCLVCVPAHLREIPRSEDDFGHQPFEFGGRTVCARCLIRVVREWVDEHGSSHRHQTDEPVLWPCTSAIILGLVPRTDEQAAMLRKVVHGCETPETHNWYCPCVTPEPASP